MANLNDFAERFRLGHASATPFTSFGLEWCSRCRMEVDCDTQAIHSGTTYGFKRWCLRCGKVIKAGLYNNVPLIAAQPMPKAAVEWVNKPERDRSPRLYAVR